MASRGAMAALGLVVAAAVVGALWWTQRTGESVEDGGTSPADVGSASAPSPAPPAAAVVKPRAKQRGGAGALVGSVRVYGTDKPVAGAKVSVSAEDVILETVTGDDGSFGFSRMPKADDWRLTVGAAEGFGETTLAGLVVQERKTTDVGVVYLAPGFAVPGVVEDERGVPIAGASVVVNEPRPSKGFDIMGMIRELPRPPRSAHSTQSDKDGKFRLTGLPPGNYLVYAKKDGHATAVERSVLVAPTAATQPIRLVMAKGYTLSGRVVRDGKGAVVGIPIVAFSLRDFMTVLDSSMPTKVMATTDAKGEFILQGLAKGEWNIVAAPPGEAMTTADEVEVPRTEPFELKIGGAASLVGRVTGDGDQPVAGAEVYCMGDKGLSNTQTDADGRYRLLGLPAGKTEMFLVQADGYCPHGTEGMFGGGAEASLELKAGENSRDVKLQPGGKVRGTIVEEGTTRPVAGATVSIMSMASIFGGAPVVTTGADGKFELVGVALGKSMLTVKKTGWCSVGPADLSPLLMGFSGSHDEEEKDDEKDPGSGAEIVVGRQGDVVERIIGLTRAFVLRGRVVSPTGEPLAGSRVTVAAESASEGDTPPELAAMMGGGGEDAMRLSDSAGRFEIFAPSPTGKFVITATYSGLLPAKSAPVEIGGATPPPETEIRLRVGGSIEGRVADDAGAAIEGAIVSWNPPEGTANWDDWSFGGELSALKTTTGADGAFRVATVPPGTVTVRIRDGRHVAARRDGVVVEEGGTARVDVTMDPGFSISGRVTRVDGKPVEKWVWLEVTRDGADERTVSVSSDDQTVEDDGRFHVDALPAGNYRLVARGQGAGDSAPVVVAAGTDGVELRLAAELVIAGFVRFKDGRPAAGVHVTSEAGDAEKTGGGANWKSAQSGPDGSFRLEGVAPGSNDLSVSVDPGKGANVRRTEARNVAAGTQGFLIEVEEALLIAGRVVGPDGAPVAKGAVKCSPTSAPVKPSEKAGEEEEDEGAIVDSWSAHPVQNGEFHVNGLSPGAHHVTIACPGFAPQSKLVDAGTTSVEFKLTAGGTIKGRVLLPDGKPAARARVEFEDTDDVVSPADGVATDADGRFVVAHVPAGVHRLVASFTAGPQMQPDGTVTRRATMSADGEELSDFSGEVGDLRVVEGQTVENVEIRLKKSE